MCSREIPNDSAGEHIMHSRETIKSTQIGLREKGVSHVTKWSIHVNRWSIYLRESYKSRIYKTIVVIIIIKKNKSKSS